MLKIYNKDKSIAYHIHNYADAKIESNLSDGDKMLSFILREDAKIDAEYYVQTENDEFIVKEITEQSDDYPLIICALNLEDLEADFYDSFSVTDKTIIDSARTVLAGTGWTVGECDITKKRNVGMVDCNTREVLQNLATAFMCDIAFDTKNKTVSFYEKRGDDKGVYFLSGINLRKLQKTTRSYDFYTRIIPIGADGLTIEEVNDGKKYIDNHQYSDKIITYLWKDENYTDKNALKEDAIKKLNDMSKPEKSYSADVIDLAKQKPEYLVMSYGIGDTVTLIDTETNTREEQRIVKITEYLEEPEKNTCELSSTVLTFEELQKKLEESAALVNYTINPDGTIKLSDILHWETGVENSKVVQGIKEAIERTNLRVGTFEANYVKTEDADVKYAKIDLANITTAAVKDLFVNVGILENAVIHEGRITGTLAGVRVVADVIEAHTIAAGDLLVTGADGKNYKINPTESGLTQEEVEQLDFEKYIDGKHIVAHSVTAQEINVQDLFAKNIGVTGSFHTGAHTTYDSEVDGVYIGDEGISLGYGTKLANYGAIDITGDPTLIHLAFYDLDKSEKLFINSDGMIIHDKAGSTNYQVFMSGISLLYRSIRGEHVSETQIYPGHIITELITTESITTESITASGDISANTFNGRGIVGAGGTLSKHGDDLLAQARINPSYIGTHYHSDNRWYNVISCRHKNGEGDGVNYGLMIYSPLQYDDPLKFRHNYNGWSAEYQLCDSGHNFASSQTITAAHLGCRAYGDNTASAGTNHVVVATSTANQIVSSLACTSGAFYIHGYWGSSSTQSTRSINVSASDIRLKENIKDSEIDAMETINKIRTVEFDWNDHPAHWEVGMIADELEEINPNFAIGGEYDDNGDVNYKTVDQWYMMGYVIKGMQEMDAKIEAQQNIIEKQQKQIDELINLIKQKG